MIDGLHYVCRTLAMEVDPFPHLDAPGWSRRLNTGIISPIQCGSEYFIKKISAIVAFHRWKNREVTWSRSPRKRLIGKAAYITLRKEKPQKNLIIQTSLICNCVVWMMHLYKLKYMHKWFVESEPVCTVSAFTFTNNNKQFSLAKLLCKIEV